MDIAGYRVAPKVTYGPDGERLPLPPKAALLFHLLVERFDECVEHNEIIARLWPPGAAPASAEGAIAQYAFFIRGALKDGPFRLESARGVGYRLRFPRGAAVRAA